MLINGRNKNKDTQINFLLDKIRELELLLNIGNELRANDLQLLKSEFLQVIKKQQSVLECQEE